MTMHLTHSVDIDRAIEDVHAFVARGGPRPLMSRSVASAISHDRWCMWCRP